jgi:glycosyltransferase involved in cell wall biosynthesis
VPHNPLVTVVTPTYNMKQFLSAAIDSVLNQNYPSIELIVVDGGSTDGSLEILEGYADRLRYSSGRDSGPCDAIHKGLAAAGGEILVWLNADDTFQPGAIRRAVEFLIDHPQVEVVYGEGWWIDEDGRPIREYPSLPFDASVLARDCFICQPAAFLRARAYHSCPLDPRQRMSFDYDLWIRMAAQGIRFAYLPEHLANTRMHSDALTLSARGQVFRASMELLRRHYGYVPFSWIFGYAAFRIDGRDQFFEPLRPSLWKYLLSLPLGLWYNPAKPFRFLLEWVSAPWKARKSYLHGLRAT